MSDMRSTQIVISERQKRFGVVLSGIFIVVALAFLVFISYVVIRQEGQTALPGRVMLPLATVIAAGNLTGFLLIRNGRHTAGIWAVYIISILVFPLAGTLAFKNVYLITGLAVVIFGSLFILEAFPQPSRRRATATAMLVVIVILLIEIWNPAFRAPSDFNAPGLGVGILTLAVLGFFFSFIPRALSGSIRSKIVAGILLTGIISLGVLSFFALNRTGQLIGMLSSQIETSVNLLAEEQLINTVVEEANTATNSFSATVSQVQSLANQLALLHTQEATLGTGTYWNAEEKLFQDSSGQYINAPNSPSSIFVPSFVNLNRDVIRELNTTAYLDFSAPFVLTSNGQVKAVYYTSPTGIVTYYPNIGFGADVPADYNATEQPTYRIATPLFNPDREPRWSFPRRDPAGVGLIVSVSVPVYNGDNFSGVITADFRLNRVEQDIQNIRVGATGYAFLVDSDGHILAMPPQGYEFFKMEPEVLKVNQEPRQTIFDGGLPFELQQITHRMVVGGSGIVSTNVGGIDYFIAYAPIANNSFSLGVIVPVAELTQSVITTRNQINAQVQVAIRNTIIILLSLLAGAIVVSLGLGQLIAAPIRRLTRTANQILEGNLAAQAEVTTNDEVGTLAQAFNAMTSRLRATFEGLEKNIEERTIQLIEANANIERRAKQFRSIAQVARTISSTLDLDSLLAQITTVISNEFGFYHVGVFLLDVSREYAVLSAANSEGGQVMLARGHRLKVGEKGMVGFVSSTGKPRVALDTGADAVFFNNPDLPNTRSEIALPLRAGEQVFGVLDVQSTAQGAFSQEDVAILATLADQVSIAIQNARQNEATRKALAESDALAKQFVKAGWQTFTNKKNLQGVHHSGSQATLLYAKGNGKGDGFNSTKQPKVKARGAVLSLPIKLRGEVIGTVDVQAPENRQWNQDELDIVAAIVERAAIAMENSRLLEEAQRRAAKERVIGEISAKISAQSDVDELLRTAALELNRNLPGTEIAIQFRKEDTE